MNSWPTHKSEAQHNGEFNGNENMRWPGHIERMIPISRKISNGRMLRRKMSEGCNKSAVPDTEMGGCSKKQSLLLYIFRATIFHI